MSFRFTILISIVFLFSSTMAFAAMSGGNFELQADSLSVVEDPFAAGGNWALTDTMGEQVALQGEGGVWELRGGFQAMDASSLSLSVDTQAVDFGELDTAAVASASVLLTASAEGSGYQVTLTEDGDLRDGEKVIDDVADNTEVTAGSEAYGFRTLGDAGQFNDNPDYAITGARVVAQSADAVDDQETTVTFRAAIDPGSTEQGNYSHQLTFTITAL